MKHLAIVIAAALASASCLAQTTSPAAASANTESVQIKAPTYKLAPHEFTSYAQPYLLDNGVVVHFYENRHRYYTQLYREAPVEIFAQSPGKFVSALGAKFDFGDDGDTIAITHLDRIPYTGLTPIDPSRVYMASR